MGFTVYLLWSERIQKYYTGHTECISRRITEHNRGKNRSTVKGMPWEITCLQEVSSLQEAIKLESKIKKRGAGRFLDDILNQQG